MKTFLISLQIFFILMTHKALSQNNWKWINPYPHANTVYSIAAAGKSTYFLATMNIVSVTRDNGSSIENLSHYTNSFGKLYSEDNSQRIAFADSLTGMLLDAQMGEFRTSDGGKSWQSFETGTSYAAAFADQKTGWKLDFKGLYKTTDAGLTWFLQPQLRAEAYQYPRSICTTDSLKAWVITRSYNFNSPGNIYFTSDGGRNWTLRSTGLKSDSLKRIQLTDMNINESGYGILLASVSEPSFPAPGNNRTFILRTMDSGKTWELTDSTEAFQLKRVLCINDSLWVIHGTGNSANSTIQLRSTNFGKTFQRSGLAPFNNASAFSASVYNPAQKTIFVSTSDGIYRSKDEGLSYDKINSGRETEIIDFSLDKNNKTGLQLAVAIPRMQNLLFISDDGGRTWRKKFLGSQGSVGFSAGFVADGVIHLLQHDRILRSSDKGDTWSLTEGYPYYKNFTLFSSRYFINAPDYYNPQISYSINGGISWVNTPVPPDYKFNSLKLYSPTEVIGCGSFQSGSSEKGFVFTSSDGATNWRILESEAVFKDIFMVAAKSGYAYSDKILYETTDKWKTMQAVLGSTDSSSVIQSVVFKDSLNGITRHYEYFSETYFNGYTWKWRKSSLSLPMTGSVKKMAFNNQGDLLVMGENGFLININGEKSHLINLKEDEPQTARYELFQNYPNPFNPVTQITFRLSEKGSVELKVFDILGREVKTLVNEVKDAGTYSVPFNATELPSGIYISRLKAGSQVMVRKMLLLK